MGEVEEVRRGCVLREGRASTTSTNLPNLPNLPFVVVPLG